MFNDHPLTTITIPHQSTHHCFSAAAQHAFYFSTTYQWHMSGFSWAERRSSGLHETCSNCTQTFSFWVLCQTRSNSEKGRPPFHLDGYFTDDLRWSTVSPRSVYSSIWSRRNRRNPFGTAGTGLHGPDVLPLSRPIKTVKSMKETWSTKPKRWPDHIQSFLHVSRTPEAGAAPFTLALHHQTSKKRS